MKNLFTYLKINKMKTILIAVMLGFGGIAQAVEVGSPFSVTETALAYSKNFDFHMGDDASKRVSAVVTYTSATPVASTFTDGRTLQLMRHFYLIIRPT